MRWVALTLAALPASALAQGVAPPVFNPKAPENVQILPAFSFATVEPVLRAIGARHQRSTSDGRPALLVTFPNNRRATLSFGSCDSRGGACKAMGIISYWTPIAASPPERTAEAIASFNRRFSFAKAFVAEDGRPALQRYLTADFGFIRGNLAVNLLVFANQAEQFATQVLRPLETPQP